MDLIFLKYRWTYALVKNITQIALVSGVLYEERNHPQSV